MIPFTKSLSAPVLTKLRGNYSRGTKSFRQARIIIAAVCYLHSLPLLSPLLHVHQDPTVASLPYTRNISNNLASDETRARPFQPSTTSNLLRLLMTFSNLDPSRAKCPPERNRDRVSNWKLEWWKRTDGEMDGWTGDDWWGKVL